MLDVFAYCQTLVRDSDRDRFIATLFAPAAFRLALFALYAFDIETSRIGASVSGPMPGEIRLQWWREVLRGERDGEAAANPVAQGVLETMRRHALPLADLDRLIEARIFDVYADPMPDLAALHAYAEETDGVVIALATRILGGDPRASTELIGHAGIASGFMRVLSGFPRHAAQHKLYVPADLLARHGANADDIFAGRDTEPLRAALADLRAHTRLHLDAARKLAADAPAAIMPALLPLVVARPALALLEKSAPFAPAEIPQWRRQWLLWRAARGGLAARL